jgi:hypothetical protein
MKSLHSLIHFLPFLLKYLLLPSPELDPILDNSLKRPSLFLYNTSARTTQKTQPLYCWEGLFTDPLPNNGRPIVARVRFCGNVFTKSLPSNGYIRHNIYMCYEIEMKKYGTCCATMRLMPTHMNIWKQMTCDWLDSFAECSYNSSFFHA